MQVRKYAKSISASAIIFLGIAGVAGCSSSTSDNSAAPSASTTMLASPEIIAPKSAEDVVKQLAVEIQTADLTVVYTEATDPNKLLGRPNGYLSKASFSDSQVSASDSAGAELGAVDLGGSVEGFATGAASIERAKYIQNNLKDLKFLGQEYDYVSGSYLLRVTGIFTPTQAEGYRVAFAKIMGEPADLILAD